MAEKPIIFSGDSVRAILERRKSQTRRVMKPQPQRDDMGFIIAAAIQGEGVVWKSPCRPGDKLWVRETWATRADLGKHVEYRASHQEPADRPFAHIYDEDTRWRSSMFMPRWASRLTLEVTDVRVQRVQEISEEDVVAEGCSDRDGTGPYISTFGGRRIISNFAALWDTLNAKRGFGWASNPWVWAYTFRVLEVPNA